MKYFSYIILFSGFLVFSSVSFSQKICLSGKPSQGNLITQMYQAKATSPVTEVIYKQYNLDTPKEEAQANCPECHNSLAKRPEDLAQVASAIEGVPQAPTLLFKPACLVESNTFDANAAEISCPSGVRSKTKDLCLTQEIMTYQNAVISSFISCAKKVGLTTLSPSALYSMYSLESGFKPQFASRNGLGMGQLTNIFVEDVHQKWRGYKFLKKIATSDLKECEAAKIIAQKDIQSKPKHSKSCSFVQMGEGMERNVLYSLVGIANLWERDLLPKMKSFMAKNANNPLLEEIQSLTLANGYGAGGRAAARAIASRLSSLSPEKYLANIKKPMMTVNSKSGKRRTLNIYSINMDKRQKNIGQSLPEPIKTEFATKGAQACLNP